MAAVSFFSSSLCLRINRGASTSLQPSPSFGKPSVACPSRQLRIRPALKKSIRAVAEEEALAPEAEPALSSGETVADPVPPSDLLKMFFKAEGTMDDVAILKVSQVLEGQGVGELKVQNAEGIASIELTQQTTLQATGVASNLVEIIQEAGFKLQTLSLSFEGDAIN